MFHKDESMSFPPALLFEIDAVANASGMQLDETIIALIMRGLEDAKKEGKIESSATIRQVTQQGREIAELVVKRREPYDQAQKRVRKTRGN